MPPTKAEKAAAEQADKVATEGLYAATEGDDNSVAVSDDGYIGVSDEYKNHANDTDAPLSSDDEDVAKLEEVAKEHEQEMAELATQVSPVHGHSVDTVHPSEAVKPQDRYIEGNRTLMDRVIAEGDDKTESSSPFGDTPPSS